MVSLFPTPISTYFRPLVSLFPTPDSTYFRPLVSLFPGSSRPLGALLGGGGAPPGMMAAAGGNAGLHLVSWNVNGIRARGERLVPDLRRLEAEIICFQETKVTRDLLDEPTAIVEGFNSYFSYSRGRTGYSGVATFCTDSAVPFAAEEGLSGILANPNGAPASRGLEGFSDEELRALDGEGRALITQHRIRNREKEEEEILTVINVYCPRADPERDDRKHYKLRFYQLLQARAQALLEDGGNVIILGDMNTAHRPIDHCQPGDLECFDAHPDRVWMNGFLSCSSALPQAGESIEGAGLEVTGRSSDGRFVDLFRLFHPTEREAYTCWRTSTGARKTNYGTRIDYIFANKSLAETGLQDCVLLPEIEGSDHCPVKAFLKARCVPAGKCPPLCTKYMPEFAGLQQKLSRFLVNVQDRESRSELEQDSRPQAKSQAEQVRPSQKRPGECITREKGKRGRGEPHPSGSLLRFFRPAVRNPLAEPERSRDPDPSVQTPSAAAGPEQAHSEGSPQEARTPVQQSKPPAAFWKSLLRGLPPAPNCPGHREPCLLRTVRKAGPNQGRQFYICPRPEGPPSNPGSRCSFFRWVNPNN
ncbi:DNA-(apurinic or apyrimidinic site) lyase 2 [Carcharodon carcharias]|uniref:DNA-(apurinic or apyrimidinic site) lyase 2 n=1 Tax=Carcharodon carcharias TaxID=13397 RepID=UPI001B7F5D71|nr:DNA-(apurinic or apyrimidinic site) lyase 2 [Carcharodon carcharias]